MTEEIQLIDVYIGEYNYWSCFPARLFRIPTHIFDERMLLGALETKEDLENLVDQVSNSGKQYIDSDYTDVYVGPEGQWTGVEWMHFKVPLDVFTYLIERKDTDKTIGRIDSTETLNSLIERSREEIRTGNIIVDTYNMERSKPKNIEVQSV